MSAIKSETMRRMDAMKAAGLTPDLLTCVDTMAPAPGGTVRLIVNARWRELYASNAEVRRAYDADVNLDDYFSRHDNEPTITNTSTPLPLRIKDITPVPPAPHEVPEPLKVTVLVAAARGYAGATKDDYIAWLLTQLADMLEGSQDAEETQGDPDEHTED